MTIASKCTGIIALSVATSAMADENANVLLIEDLGFKNELMITQTPQAQNSLHVSLAGTGNGASQSGLWHATGVLPFTGTLEPGLIAQQGFGHSTLLTVSGDTNLFAVLQTGSHHSMTGTIQGSHNQALVVQSGHGQTAGFSQIGSRNSLSIQQSSW